MQPDITPCCKYIMRTILVLLLFLLVRATNRVLLATPRALFNDSMHKFKLFFSSPGELHFSPRIFTPSDDRNSKCGLLAWPRRSDSNTLISSGSLRATSPFIPTLFPTRINVHPYFLHAFKFIEPAAKRIFSTLLLETAFRLKAVNLLPSLKTKMSPRPYWR